LSAQWQDNSNAGLDRLAVALTGLWQNLSQPERARRLRQCVMLILALWAIWALAELVWIFLPRPTTAIPPDNAILNPMESRPGAEAARPVDIERMLSWHLFGEAGAVPAQVVAKPAEVSDRDGIEKGARETRLDLKLRGVVAATEDGLGHAIIEYRSKQSVYAVGDKMPVGGKVTLAKVMNGSVVLDNGGKYELLRLFEDNALLKQLPTEPAPRSRSERKNSPTTQITPQGYETTTIARNFRSQLYENPQSLAEVVRVSAVRENNVLRGYRVAPGKNGEQFSQLGFKSGDIVTAVNGINLDNPGNTMQLYQVMRTASEAVFDLEREGESVTLTVSLGDVPQGG